MRNNNILKIKSLLGKKIRQLRKEKKMSIEQLAAKSELHTTYVGDIERGNGNASITTLAKIANALDVEVYELCRFSMDMIDEKILMERFRHFINDKEKISLLKEIYLIIKELFY